MKRKGRVLAVDTGDVRLGIAVSDPTRLIARPLTVVKHTSLRDDVREVVQLAYDHQAVGIVVGVPLGTDGEVGHQAREALRFAQELEQACDLEVVTWDESGSTITAEALPNRKAETDAAAAAVFLQDYLDANQS